MSAARNTHIVIATRNADKFRIVSDLLRDAGLHSYTFGNLQDFPGYTEDEEQGSIEERAEQKANACMRYLKESGVSSLPYVIGVDDGMRLPGHDIADPNSKEVTASIVRGDVLKPGETMHIVRAYGLCVPSNGTCHHAITEIPFLYRGGTPPEGAHYPLSYVLSYTGRDAVVADESEDFVRAQNLEASKGIRPLVSIIEKT